jgi:DNA processing protein
VFPNDHPPAAYAHALLTLARARPAEDLTRVYERIGGMVAAFGSVRDVVALMAAQEIRVPVAPDPLFIAEFVDIALRESVELVMQWEQMSFGLHAFATPSYPRQLEEIADAPPLLFHIGDDTLLHSPSVAVVGTRKATAAGLKRAMAAAEALAELDITVVSGMAVGIDTAAHEAALAAGGKTVAVMGTAIDRRYPVENKALAERIIASDGALVSEFAPRTSTQRWHFLRRNRTMSGLAIGTLVIEASDTSGAKSQAIAAVQHGRPVFLVKSHAWAEKLVHEGLNGSFAIEVGDRDDFVALVRPGVLNDDEQAFG